jgi:hypothetical protein
MTDDELADHVARVAPPLEAVALLAAIEHEDDDALDGLTSPTGVALVVARWFVAALRREHELYGLDDPKERIRRFALDCAADDA